MKNLFFYALFPVSRFMPVSYTHLFLGSIEWIKHNIEKVCLGIIFISILPMIISFIRSKMAKKNA